MDNCRHSAHSEKKAKGLVNDLCQLLQNGEFEICHWASHIPAVTEHLPSDARSESSELWLSKTSMDLQDPTLGLHWGLLQDSVRYKHRLVERVKPTLRNVYKVLACQNDPLG